MQMMLIKYWLTISPMAVYNSTKAATYQVAAFHF